MRKLSHLELGLPAICLATFLFLGFQHWDRGNDRPGWAGRSACRTETLDQGGDCGCSAVSPVHAGYVLSPEDDATGRAAQPFGMPVRGGLGEGQRGLQFLASLSAPVMAPVTGTITGLESAPRVRREYQAQARTLSIDADCGIRVTLEAVMVDSNLKVGQRVAKGQILGLMARLTPPFGPGRFSLHFDVEVEPGKNGASALVSPAAFFDSAGKAQMAGRLGKSWHGKEEPPTVICRSQKPCGIIKPWE